MRPLLLIFGALVLSLVVAADHQSASPADATPLTQTPSTDADGDGVWDLDEINCGVSSLGVSLRPEQLNDNDDDGDTVVDEALPSGSEAWDCDGDGYTGVTEAHVFSGASDRDQHPCGTTNWPADFVSGGIPESTDKVTITDLTSFLAPTRHVGTNVGDTPGNVRWDIVPGSGLFSTDINIQDLTSVIASAPAMFGGNRAFNGQACGLLGCTASDACCPTYAGMGIRLCITSDRLVYHTGELVGLNLAVTNVTQGDVGLFFSTNCTTDTSTASVAGNVFWTSAGMFVCTPIVLTFTLGPGQTQNFGPINPPAPAVDDYRVMVALKASGCGSFPNYCYAPSCASLMCFNPSQPGYAIRRVP